MMLTTDQLSESLREAGKAASVCGRLCRTGSEIDSQKYHLWHSGIGDSDTSDEIVHSTTALALAQAAWQQRLESWLKRLHEHAPRLDLNTGS
jgi:hypothetical protein